MFATTVNDDDDDKVKWFELGDWNRGLTFIHYVQVGDQ